MIPLVAERTSELAELCRRHHVKRLDIFGSAAVGDFNPENSDIDFLVDFGNAPRKPRYGNHIDLKEDLETLFNRKVDLVDDTAIKNPTSENPLTKPGSKYMRRDPKCFLRDIQHLERETNPDFLDDFLKGYQQKANVPFAKRKGTPTYSPPPDPGGD